ncbi:hypothetical protein PDPUS_2_00822 [Photobacterium damselae subsp. piscicida]|uniref:Fanconi-associated nuclease 1-like winged-helix domain-containing protein n=1 Tax=Photobacterium damsela subsp. piscicida TaxID=38294 RepID=A0A1V1VE90_PHODP|nr:hypothetical protein [Photobacterium damselae]MDP2531413.1 hypothetical protein [Photobacterium damselae subsp. piscicida]MDP2556767.1 hypothetical protein [Photobacterium damselae subsp. piscicida]QOD54899.1 hypothetical protein IC628_18290 [Photobacterium damselae subsp. piscicida]QOD58248.1 hypothetical protein IC627_21065 [Photobacterium damselae subsp. piscicida]BAX55408.1 hypothetical protein PDPUS_2_00822 [Photobacterium damselae subsp. piscicida]
MIEKIELPADYYLSNFKQLLSTVSQYHTRLLTNEESAWIESFYRLNSDAQKLWVRLLTRKGLLFRVNKLKYTEINHLQQTVSQLAINHLVVTPIDLLMVKFTFYKRSNNLIVHLFAFRKTNGFSY